MCIRDREHCHHGGTEQLEQVCVKAQCQHQLNDDIIDEDVYKRQAPQRTTLLLPEEPEYNEMNSAMKTSYVTT